MQYGRQEQNIAVHEVWASMLLPLPPARYRLCFPALLRPWGWRCPRTRLRACLPACLPAAQARLLVWWWLLPLMVLSRMGCLLHAGFCRRHMQCMHHHDAHMMCACVHVYAVVHVGLWPLCCWLPKCLSCCCCSQLTCSGGVGLAHTSRKVGTSGTSGTS